MKLTTNTLEGTPGPAGGALSASLSPRPANLVRAAKTDFGAAPAAPAAPAFDAIEAAAHQIESYLRRVDSSLRFDIDSTTGLTVVTVRNVATGELVRQIPNEEVLRIAQCLANRPSALVNMVA